MIASFPHAHEGTLPEQTADVSWLWSRRLARGKLTALVGDPGLGKSFLTIDMSARITTGRPWPDGEPAPSGSVIVLSAEDGLADTVRPRLDACGADASRVYVLDAVRTGDGESRSFSLETDIEHLRQAIATTGAILVVIDPLSSYLGKVDTYKDADVRRVLGPLVRLATETRVAILGLFHLTKDSKAKALQRGMGSMAFVAVPRVVLAVGPDPTESNPQAPGAGRALASLKQNICEPAMPWSYAIVNGRVEWRGAREDLSADVLLTGTTYHDAEARQDVEAFLRECLADGEWHLQSDIVTAAETKGLTYDRLARTRKKICDSEKVGFGTGKWYWRLKDRLGVATTTIPLSSPPPAKNGSSMPLTDSNQTAPSFFADTANNGEGAKNGAGVNADPEARLGGGRVSARF